MKQLFRHAMMENRRKATAILPNSFTPSLCLALEHEANMLPIENTPLVLLENQSESTLVFLNYHVNRFISITLMKKKVTLLLDGSVHQEWHCDFIGIDLDTSIVYYESRRLYYNDCYTIFPSNDIALSRAVCGCSCSLQKRKFFPSQTTDKEVITPTYYLPQKANDEPKCMRSMMCQFLHLHHNKCRRLTVKRRRCRSDRKVSPSINKIPINQLMITSQTKDCLTANLIQVTSASKPPENYHSQLVLLTHHASATTTSSRAKCRHRLKNRDKRRNYALFRGLSNGTLSSKSSDSSSSDNDNDQDSASDSDEVRSKSPTSAIVHSTCGREVSLSSYGADNNGANCAPPQLDNLTQPGLVDNTKSQPAQMMNNRDGQLTITSASLPVGEDYGSSFEQKKIDEPDAATYQYYNPPPDENTLPPLIGATVTHSHLHSWQQSGAAISNENYLHTFDGLTEYCDENSIPRLDSVEDCLSQVPQSVI